MAVRFVPFESAVDPSFWQQLRTLKLEQLRLDEGPVNLNASFTNTNARGSPAVIVFDYSSLQAEAEPRQAFWYKYSGSVTIFNSLEAFKGCDKQSVLNAEGERLSKCIADHSAFIDPSQICRCLLIAHIDIKKFQFIYWFAFPALLYPEGLKLVQRPTNLEEGSEILNALSQWTEIQPYFLLLEKDAEVFEVKPLAYLENIGDDNKHLYLVFVDPHTIDDAFGWPLRNLLAMYASVRPTETMATVISWRRGRHSSSLLCRFEWMRAASADDGQKRSETIGWQWDTSGKLLPRSLDLSKSLDPKCLAESAARLNLNLMRWRLLPELKSVDSLSTTKCLLLGAGTLGCALARCLLAWGIHRLQLVDSGRVSYSNPPRQWLYDLEDCQEGGKWKATAAAAALKRIYPSAECEGVVLRIPMPGHVHKGSVDEQGVRDECMQLESLIKNADAVFLMTDSRESRWLPTLMAYAYNKLAFSVALGFDSLLVIRHGLGESGLGCYFCSDVVAPGDSQSGRTLDQQCTVTRAGLSPMAAGIAAEMFISVLHHPLGGAASSDSQGPLGSVPHQIRIFLTSWHLIQPAVQRFSQCTACSHLLINEFKENGIDWLLNVALTNPKSLEQITGLQKLKELSESAQVIELTDSDTISIGSREGDDI